MNREKLLRRTFMSSCSIDGEMEIRCESPIYAKMSKPCYEGFLVCITPKR